MEPTLSLSQVEQIMDKLDLSLHSFYAPVKKFPAPYKAKIVGHFFVTYFPLHLPPVGTILSVIQLKLLKVVRETFASNSLGHALGEREPDSASNP